MQTRTWKSSSPIQPKFFIFLVLLVLLSIILGACGAANEANNTPNDLGNDNDAENIGDEPDGLLPTKTPYPEERIEDWLVDLEWPDTIFLGESDVIRLTLTPSETGLTIEAEFSDHQSVSKEVPITRPNGYLLNAVANLHSSTFEISPPEPQTRELVTGKSETWHWSITPQQSGKHRLFLEIKMEWVPLTVDLPIERNFGLISHAFEIDVDSYFGLTKNQFSRVFIILGAGIVFGLVGIGYKKANPSSLKNTIRESIANPNVRLEPEQKITLTNQERTLLQTVFSKYARVVIEKEFMSGYSGARTFMTTPIQANRRADAYSIIKISGRESINREFHNYQAYVKNTLPPTTARIQETPVSVKRVGLAALRYTFIGAPGNLPQSLRQIMEETPDPDWFDQLASSYGPSWWLQASPYTFLLSKEYDRKLPAHYVIRPSQDRGKVIDGRLPLVKNQFNLGDLVSLKHFRVININPTRERISLISEPEQGSVPIKVTYLGSQKPKEFRGEIIASRDSVLSSAAENLKLFGLPNPLERLPTLLNQTIAGSRSIIHGDLNLENILIGPGNIIWLIDFSETREGHTLFDFAHLYTELIAHLFSRQYHSPDEYLEKLATNQLDLLLGLQKNAGQFLFNSGEDKEFKLAAAISCIGALKYTNLESHAKQLLYLTAAYLLENNL